LKAAGWLTLVLDARQRVGRLVESGLPAQLGGAAGPLASYVEYWRQADRPGPQRGGHAGPDVDRGAQPDRGATRRAHPRPARGARVAGQGGLSEPAVPWHALRAPLADVGAVSAFVTGALGKLALDVQGMSRTEVGEVVEPVAEGRGVSSAMPQKRNPVLATL